MAGVELGCNYPRPLVDVDTAKRRLQDALDSMWQKEASQKAIAANGVEEGLGDTTEVTVALSAAPARVMRVHRSIVREGMKAGEGDAGSMSVQGSVVLGGAGGEVGSHLSADEGKKAYTAKQMEAMGEKGGTGEGEEGGGLGTG